MNKMILPKPDCEGGYTRQQVADIMGVRLPEFLEWMDGQTQMICEGREYDHETKQYKPACGGVAHGDVTYPHDVARFLMGLPVID